MENDEAIRFLQATKAILNTESAADPVRRIQVRQLALLGRTSALANLGLGIALGASLPIAWATVVICAGWGFALGAWAAHIREARRLGRELAKVTVKFDAAREQAEAHVRDAPTS